MPADVLGPDDLLSGQIAAPDEDPIDDGELQLLVKMTTRHFHENLPAPASFPALALRAMELVQQPNVEIRALSSIVGQDPALSACVLRVANSALYNRGNPISDLNSAITRLGLSEVSSLVSGMATKALFDPTARAEYKLFTDRWNTLFHHSMTTALSAGRLAQVLHRGNPSRTFLGGMFHEIGKSIALRSVCSIALSGRTRLHPDDRAIDRLLDKVHVEVGAELHTVWKLPSFLGELCARHHEEDLPSTPNLDDVHVVRVASGLALFRFDPHLNRPYAGQLLRSMQVLGMGRPELDAFKIELERRAERVAANFGIADPAVAARAVSAAS